METRVRKLYDRFLEGKATKEEINEIYDRITASPEELKEFREYEKFWEQIHKPSEEVLASLADVKATIKSYKRRRMAFCVRGLCRGGRHCRGDVQNPHRGIRSGDPCRGGSRICRECPGGWKD